jgi:molybdate transport system ATP-binding protein
MRVLKADIALQRPNFRLKVDCEISNPVTGIFGASGAGKTTFLKTLAGLATPDEGSISIGNTLVFNADKNTNLPPEKRKVGFVFQEGRLFPHLNVAQNLRYGMHKATTAHFQEVIEMLQISDLLSSKVSEISGGQAQRVAIGRALLHMPDILLLDEPFSALDKGLRHYIITLLKPLIAKYNLAVIVVSHELADLLMLTNNLIIMQDGRSIAHGNYFQLVANKQVLPKLSATGLINALDVTIDGLDAQKGLISLSKNGQTLQAEPWMQTTDLTSGASVHVVLRPEDITLASHEITDISIQNQLPATIKQLIVTENKTICLIDCGFQLIAEVSLATTQKMRLQPGDSIWCLFKAAAVKVNTMPANGRL